MNGKCVHPFIQLKYTTLTLPQQVRFQVDYCRISHIYFSAIHIVPECQSTHTVQVWSSPNTFTLLVLSSSISLFLMAPSRPIIPFSSIYWALPHSDLFRDLLRLRSFIWLFFSLISNSMKC